MAQQKILVISRCADCFFRDRLYCRRSEVGLKDEDLMNIPDWCLLPDVGTGADIREQIKTVTERSIAMAYQAGSGSGKSHNSILVAEELTAKIEQIIAGGTVGD